jgi:hypothetical protein
MTAGGALITGHLVKGPLRFSPHPFGARLQAGCAPRAASGPTLDPLQQVKRYRSLSACVSVQGNNAHSFYASDIALCFAVYNLLD